MVRYYGRARQITGTVFTNQPGLKQAGCPGTVGKRGTIVRFLGRRVNCNLKTCGLPMSGLRCKYGVRQALGNMNWKAVETSNNPAIPNYCHQVVNKWNGVHCRYPQPKNRQLAGGVGNIYSPRRDRCEQTCSLGWEEKYMNKHPDGPVGGGPVNADCGSPLTTACPMNISRLFLGAAVGPAPGAFPRGDALYAVGGFGRANKVVSSVETWNLSGTMTPENGWMVSSQMNVGRGAHGVAFAGSQLYAVGGFSTTAEAAISTGEVYNPTTNKWTTIADMSVPRAYPGIIGGIADDYGPPYGTVLGVYAVGGINGSGHTVATGEVYNPTTNRWTTIADMSGTRCYFGLAYDPVGIQGSLYAVGGNRRAFSGDAGYAVLDTVERYTVADDKWDTNMPTMTTPRQFHGVALVRAPDLSGVIHSFLYAAGGLDGSGNMLTSVEVCVDPSLPDAKWMLVGNMDGACLGAGVTSSVKSDPAFQKDGHHGFYVVAGAEDASRTVRQQAAFAYTNIL